MGLEVLEYAVEADVRCCFALHFVYIQLEVALTNHSDRCGARVREQFNPGACARVRVYFVTMLISNLPRRSRLTSLPNGGEIHHRL